MRKIRPFSLLAIALSIVACGGGNAVFTPGETVYEPRYAGGFTVYEAGKESRAIRITDPWQGAEGVEQWVFVARNGETAPEGFTGTVIPTPPRRIVSMSTSYNAFLTEIGVADRIVGVSGGDFITDPSLAARYKADDIAEVGYEGNLDFERITSLRPDLVIMFGLHSGESGMTDKLREMNVPYVFVGEYLEPSPLGRTEWMVVLGEMLDETDDAKARFAAIEQSYNSLKTDVSDGVRRPEVMFNAPYRDVWYVPGDRNYTVQLVRDAGGEYVCRGVDSRDSRPVDIEQAYVAMQRADVWINTNDYSTIGELLADNPRFASVPPVRSGRVYNNNARTTPAGGSDFWESGVVRPDIVLRDLVRILQPAADGEFPADSTLYYYRRLK